MPVLRSDSVRDPLAHYITDHIRYRYCAALVLREPRRALTTPLHVLNQEGQQPHAATTWPDQPCHQAGIVHLLLHAPFEWWIEADLVSEVWASRLYCLLLLVFAHACIYVLARNTPWWAPLAVGPFVIRCALLDVQEPIAMFFGLLATVAWARRCRAAALMLAVVAGATYNRWLVLLPAMAWLGWREREPLKAELRKMWQRPGTRLALGATALLLVLSVAPALLVLGHLPPGEGRSRPVLVFLLIYFTGAAAMLARNRDNRVAPFVLVASLHLALHRQQMEFWYLAPLLSPLPLVRSRGELLLWMVGLWMATEGYVAGSGALFKDILSFGARGWYGALHP